MIYADNAATTKMSEIAQKAMLSYFDTNYGNPSSMHLLGRKAKSALVDSRSILAESLNCKPSEITFTSSGTESDNQAIISAANLGRKSGKKHIITSAIEHPAVLNTLKKLEKDGYDVTYIPVDKTGIIKIFDIKAAIKMETCLVTIMYANNEIGTIQPIAQIGRLCKDENIIFHSDAIQAVGHIKIDVQRDNLDMLSLSSHKFHGPKGVGALYTKNGITLTSLLEGGPQERGKRAGSENLPAIVSMAKALEESCKNIDSNYQKVKNLRNSLLEKIQSSLSVNINGDLDERLPGNLNIYFDGIEGEELLLLLDARGICVSHGSACSSGSLEPSSVLLAIGLSKQDANSAIRISLDEYNCEDEIESIAHSIKEIVEYLKQQKNS